MAILDQALAQQLAASGQLDPAVAAQLSGQPAQTAPMSVMPPQQAAALDAQIAQNQAQPALAEQVPFDLSPPAASDYTSTSGSLATGTPASPDVSPAFQAQAQAEAAPQIEAMAPDIQPDVVNDVIAQQEIVEPVKQEMANAKAAEHAEKLVAADIQQKNEQLDADAQKLQNLGAQQDDKAFYSVGEIFSKGTFGQKLGTAIAILIGGASQGLLGSKSNPVLDLLDKEVAAQTEKRKLKLAEQEALRKALLEQYNRKLEERKQSNDDAKTKAEITKLQAEAAKYGAEADEKQRLANLARVAASGTSNVDDYINAIEAANPEQGRSMRQRRVELPNGKVVLSSADGARVAEFEKGRKNGESGIKLLDDIENLANNYNKFSPTDRAKMESMLITATGKLRETLVGPGAMQQKEYERMRDAIGNPSSFASWKNRELSRLNVVRNMIKSDINQGAKSIGVQWPKSKAESVVDTLVQKGYTLEQAERTVSNLKSKGKL